MVRLMCSKDRQGLQGLESELRRAGIQYEIRGNPLTAALGIARFEVHVDQADWPAAANIWQGLATARDAGDAPQDHQGTGAFDGFVEPAESGLVIEAKVIPASDTDPPPEDDLDRRPDIGRAKPRGDLAQVTASLEEDVGALLARDLELVNRCSALEEKAKALDEALERTRADLAREVSARSGAETKLAEVSEMRASLEKEMHALELRLKTSEQALAVAQSRLASQAQQREQLIKERNEEHLQTQACVGTVNDLRSQIRARLAAREKKHLSPPPAHKPQPVAEKERTAPRQGGV